MTPWVSVGSPHLIEQRPKIYFHITPQGENQCPLTLVQGPGLIFLDCPQDVIPDQDNS